MFCSHIVFLFLLCFSVYSCSSLNVCKRIILNFFVSESTDLDFFRVRYWSLISFCWRYHVWFFEILDFLCCYPCIWVSGLFFRKFTLVETVLCQSTKLGILDKPAGSSILGQVGFAIEVSLGEVLTSQPDSADGHRCWLVSLLGYSFKETQSTKISVLVAVSPATLFLSLSDLQWLSPTDSPWNLKMWDTCGSVGSNPHWWASWMFTLGSLFPDGGAVGPRESLGALCASLGECGCSSYPHLCVLRFFTIVLFMGGC